MSETGDRVKCPKCGANNFLSSAVCWQCGEPLPRQESATPPAVPQPGPQPTPTPTPRWPEGEQPGPRRDNTQTLIILGFVGAVLGLCCCPIFAIVGIILGVVVQRRGNSVGAWIIVVSAFVLVVGVILTIVSAGKYLEMMQKGQFPGMPPGKPFPYPPTR